MPDMTVVVLWMKVWHHIASILDRMESMASISHKPTPIGTDISKGLKGGRGFRSWRRSHEEAPIPSEYSDSQARVPQNGAQSIERFKESHEACSLL